MPVYTLANAAREIITSIANRIGVRPQRSHAGLIERDHNDMRSPMQLEEWRVSNAELGSSADG